MKKLTATLLALVAALVLTSTAMATSPLLPSITAGGLSTVDPDNPALIATNVYAGNTYNIIIDTDLAYDCLVATYYADGRYQYLGTISESKRLTVRNSGTLILVITPRYGWGNVVAIVELAQ